MTRPSILFFLTGSVLTSPFANGQLSLPDLNPPPNEQKRTIYENSRKVSLGLTLDRTNYIAGETVRLTLSAFNTTTETLSVFDPFAESAMGLAVAKWGDREKLGFEHWEGVNPDSLSQMGIPWNAPTVTLGPGQRIERQFIFADSGCAGCESPGPASGPPLEGGAFQLTYCYAGISRGCGYAGFTVEVPLHRASATVLLPLASGGYADAVLMQVSERHYIVVPRNTHSNPGLQIGLNREFQSLHTIAPFDRIVEVGPNTDALRMTADDAGNLGVQWTENGTDHSFCVDAARTSIRACDPAPPAAIHVAVKPPTATLSIGYFERFVASVTGTSDTAVTWSASPGPGAPANAPSGTINAEGLFSPPTPTTSGSYPIVITARSHADPAQAAKATVIFEAQEKVGETVWAQGPRNMVAGILYDFTAGGGRTNLGHAVQYTFDWGDGTSSGWLTPGTATAPHAFRAAGRYEVTAMARCAAHTEIASSRSRPFPVAVVAGERISGLSAPSGPAGTTIGAAEPYTAHGTVSSIGDAVQYRFHWGDGTQSAWLPVGTTSAAHAWTAPGAFAITVEARCARHPGVVSDPSKATTVTVTRP